MEIDKPFIVYPGEGQVYLQYINNFIEPKINKLLSININTNEVKLENPDIIKQKNLVRSINAKAILGIINIKDVEYILFVSSNKIVGKMKGEIIFKISEVEFCEIPNNKLNKVDDEKNQIQEYKEGISKLLKLGFYYSFGLDLTNSQQNQFKINYSNKKKTNNENIKLNAYDEKIREIYNTSYKKYFFNYNLYKRFIDQDTLEPIDYTFITPVICGYIGIFEHLIENRPFQFILITRRSQNNAGTRYNTRGVNDDGNVANFCESEQIVIYKNILCSYCQLRGSAPIFFEQIGLRANTDITRDKNMTINAFNRHLKEMQEDFKLICFINLLNKKKATESPIIKEFEQQIEFKVNEKPKFRYIYFDMQNECPKDNYSNIDNLMNTLSPFINLFNFFSYDLTNNNIYSIQKGTMRTNCLDCLDRTNVIQTRISWKVLEKMFTFLQIDNNTISNIFNQNENFFTLGENYFKEGIKNIWAENGDLISIQYAGTESTITTVTKTGGHTIKGFIKHSIATVSRFYQGSFEDDFKQECIDTFLQKYTNNNYISEEEKDQLFSRKEEFTRFMDFTLFIGNFNLAEKNLDNDNDIIIWLTSYQNHLLENITYDEKENQDINDIKKKLPEFYILGFEEVKSNTEKKIKDKVTSVLNKINANSETPYQFMKELQQSDTYILVFVKASCIKYVKNFDQQFIKTSYVTRKGSCLLRFNINDTTVALSCNHLSYGEDKNEERKEEITDILNTNFKKYPNLIFKNYDYFFLFGDLNIRIDLWVNDQLILDLVKYHSRETNYDFTKLYQYDQFLKYVKENNIISEMCEPEIRFSPTYKYNIGNTQYDVTKRTPSWCDRIFYKKFSKTKPLAYNKCLLTVSDHQPIYGVYKIRTEIINKEQKQNVLNQIIKNRQKNQKLEHKNNNDANLNKNNNNESEGNNTKDFLNIMTNAN
jgi:hypothetical protein